MLILTFSLGLLMGLMAGARFPTVFRTMSRGMGIMAHYFTKIIRPFKLNDL